MVSRGWSVWWDPMIRPGQSWDHVVEQALDEARHRYTIEQTLHCRALTPVPYCGIAHADMPVSRASNVRYGITTEEGAPCQPYLMRLSSCPSALSLEWTAR